jgi:hypothetical protein
MEPIHGLPLIKRLHAESLIKVGGTEEVIREVWMLTKYLLQLQAEYPKLSKDLSDISILISFVLFHVSQVLCGGGLTLKISHRSSTELPQLLAL